VVELTGRVALCSAASVSVKFTHTSSPRTVPSSASVSPGLSGGGKAVAVVMKEVVGMLYAAVKLLATAPGLPSPPASRSNAYMAPGCPFKRDAVTKSAVADHTGDPLTTSSLSSW